MIIIRNLLFLWLFWWIFKKILNFLSPKKNNDNSSSINKEREGIFKLDDKDIQDAEFEEINED